MNKEMFTLFRTENLLGVCVFVPTTHSHFESVGTSLERKKYVLSNFKPLMKFPVMYKKKTL